MPDHSRMGMAYALTRTQKLVPYSRYNTSPSMCTEYEMPRHQRRLRLASRLSTGALCAAGAGSQS